MKKRKLSQREVSNDFLTSLLAPFIPMSEFVDLVVDGETGKIMIYYKEGGVKDSA